MYDHYLPIVIAALVILLLGCWNPKALQMKQNGRPTGCPNSMWLALAALLSGIASCYILKQGGLGLEKLNF
jgi:hypothetical protein